MISSTKTAGASVTFLTDHTGRYMNVAACATYIGRTVKAVYHLVDERKIPVIRVGRKLTFDRERIDRWLDRHAQKGAMV
jgi:excisionase family DNA binding protein